MRTLVLGLGGAVGALARYGLSRLLPAGATGFPTATFAVNVGGAFALGLFLGWWECSGKESGVMPAFVAVGILGGLTTFSTLAVEVVDRANHHGGGLASTYVVATVVGSLGAVATGAMRGRRMGQPS